MNKVLYVGMDVHKESIVVATAESVSGEVSMFGQAPNNTAAVDKMIRKLSSRGRKPEFVYEAGPCGYWLARHLQSRGFPCMVAAPSLIPNFTQKTRWSAGYVKWVREISMGDIVLQTVLAEYLETAIERHEKVEQIDQTVQNHAAQWESAHLVKIYRGFRGVSDRIAVLLAAELGDMSRFPKATGLSAYLGLTPSEHSSGKKVRRGGITKTGPRHIRRALVQAAWTYERDPKMSVQLIKRQEGLPKHIKEISWKAQLRLNKRYHALVKRHMKAQKALTAVARELCGFLWAAYHGEQSP